MKTTKTALLSVSDKTGIVEFAYALSKLGWEIVSAGGTAKLLRQSELEVREVKDILPSKTASGRLDLCHPAVLAAVTADRDSPGAMHELERLGVPPIDLVAVNLYPLADVLQEKDMTHQEVMDYLDVPAGALLRAAARNFRHVVVLGDPRDYPAAVDALRDLQEVSFELRKSWAAKAFHSAAYYDSTVAQYLSPSVESLPEEMVIGLKKAADLKYGENPHQQAAVYRLSGARPWGLAAAEPIHGKALYYEHYLSLEVAAELAAEFAEAACAIVKHMSPAGVAVSPLLGEAARLAYASDPRGCTGGVAAFNREVDEEAARVLAPQYLECLLAPRFSPEALDRLRPKKDLRLLTMPSMLLSPNEIDLRPVSGGLLIQDKDNQTLPQETRCVTRRRPDELETQALLFAWRVAKHAKTHAIVLARGTATLGIGCGQPSRADALRLALVKSQERHPIVAPNIPVVMASDGPISVQHVLEAAAAGVGAVIQPGGSAEDKETVRACESRKVAMLFTGIRHHRH